MNFVVIERVDEENEPVYTLCETHTKVKSDALAWLKMQQTMVKALQLVGFSYFIMEFPDNDYCPNCNRLF